MRFIYLTILSVLFSISFTGCNPEEEKEVGKTSLDKINDWVYREMEYWYFWTDDLPGKPETNVNPYNFFNQLKVDEDRFSFIHDNYDELVDLFNGISLESGFEYRLYTDTSNSSNVVMQVVYIKADSPADLLGLKRGDVIFEINGVVLNHDNYRSLITAMNEPYEAAYNRYNPQSETYEFQESVTINPVEYSENPILLDTVYTINNKKIGYLIYTFFAPGPTTESTLYDDQLKSVFTTFQSKGIDEFILDLRFNNGGNEKSMQTLTSLLVQNASTEDLMYKKQYNNEIQQILLNDERYGEDFLNIKFLDEPANIGHSLSSGKVHVITSKRSASASEVTINSLKPYMEVFIVGDTTVGKDAGSVTLHEADNAENEWAIQPIVVKIVNRNGEDYPWGFVPNVTVENNFSVLKPLGDTDEPLLGTTLAAMGIQNARFSFPTMTSGEDPVYSSVDGKVWSNRIIMSHESDFR